RGPGGLLHDLAELTRHDQPAGARVGRRLDEEHVPADGGDSETGGHAGVGGALADLAGETARAEPLAHALLVDPDPTRLSLGDAKRRLPEDVGDPALETADARLTRVLAGDEADRLLREVDLAGLQAALLELPGDEVSPGDLDLLVLRIPRELDQVHPVAKRRRDRLQQVGRADEEHLRQIEGEVEVVIPEGRVL